MIITAMKLVILWILPLLAWGVFMAASRVAVGTRYIHHDLDWLFLMLAAAFVAVNPMVARVEPPHVHLLVSLIGYIMWLCILMYVAVWAAGAIFREYL